MVRGPRAFRASLHAAEREKLDNTTRVDPAPACGRSVPGPQATDQRLVGGGELIVAEMLRCDPGDRRCRARLDRSRVQATMEERELDRRVVIRPDDGLHTLADVERRAELLRELASQALLERLVRVPLPARELPHAGQVRSQRTARNQVAAAWIA